MNNSRKFAYGKPGLFQALGTIIAIPIISILTSDACLAQIIPDTTLGNQNSRVMSGVNIKGNGADLIEGGVQSGTNLFHSFAEFNVNNGQRVYFANPTGIANILSRVTGNNPSNILGTLGVNGAANLFLLNPKGIIFGPNAQLDIQGSFLVTTANSFQFPDGSEFSATNPQAPPLLTMTVPVGVQFGSQPAASITNQGNLVTGKDLTLNAGNLDLQGQLQAGGNLTLQAQDTLKVRDSATNPFIAAAGGNLLAQGNQKVDISALNHPDSGFYSGGDMVLQSENTIGGDAHFWAGGNFRIEKLNGDLGNLFSPDDPLIRATGDVSFGSYTGASLHILAGGSVKIDGDVTITGVDTTSNSIKETVTLSDGTKIDIDGGKTPTLDIRTGVDSNYIGTPKFTPDPPMGFDTQNPTATNTPTNANINIEGIISNTSGFESNSGDILITNQYHPNKLAGDITTGVISTYGNVAVDSRGDITTKGKIDTTIFTDFVGENRTAGSIRLLANQDILIDTNSSVLSYTVGTSNGNGGNIYLNSQNGKIDINGQISSESNNGIAGNVTIQALGNISVFNSNIEAISNNESKKYNNYITINSTKGSLDLNHSQLNTTNKGSGYAGYIITNASDKISLLNGSKILSNGNSGLIFIGINLIISTGNDGLIYFDIDRNKIYTPKNVFINNQSEINTTGEEAGGIIINASDKISLLNGSKISSQGHNGLLLIGINDKVLSNTTGLTLSGINNIDNPKSIIIDNSEINTDSNGSAKAGNISIDASDQISIINGSEILSNGNQGNIFIGDKYTPKSFLLDKESHINTNNVSSNDTNGFQVAGNIKINARDQVSIVNESNISSKGSFGNIEINAGSLSLNQKSEINTNNVSGNATNGFQFAGDIVINARDQVSILNESNISSKGNFGSISIDTGSLSLNHNSEINTNSNVSGNASNNNQIAGDILINASEKISILNESNISSKGNFGFIVIDTGSLFLNHNSEINTNNDSGDAGYINITTNNLLLRRQSKISTTAVNQGSGGKGGYIIIDAKDGFVIAVPSENSDIIANAFGGKGGTIQINANRILGFKKQENLKSEQLRGLDKNHTSDISASSDVGDNGEVSLNTLSIDPSQGLVALPTNLVDPSRLIAQGCDRNSNVAKGQSEFVITGRGGLPPSPDDTLKPGDILHEWVVNNTVNNSNNSGNMTESNLRQLSSNISTPLVEAVGMVRSANGDIVLTAQSTTATLLQSGLSTQACNVTQGNVR
ncbi:filamentous hemagglutinin N-terminal domain-containing protein [Nostoc punctiforme FACHB-252]|uniref:Filamentous hemagglutinin N-terminal domain-containing protein n=1 Tax=Nostoc punctiforme FACHB-252 TaxID=1357509 RepID=A0ABR8HBA1_NOSPU|nr:filamentous hemagglutinin N-terminal domain-containing protein [Nostoc punctiforme]MBD2612575.1 filamentous hemagglutinin N-terminal domain-containing protein [Nostoc punctiforme FACHB-252]